MAVNNKAPGLLLRNAGIFNPVLVQAVGLCPVVAMATSLKSAALLSAVAAFAIIFSEFFASAFLKKIDRWIRTGIYIIIGAALIAPIMYFLEKANPELFGSLGIYLPVMAINSLLVLRCERFAVKIKPLPALADGVTASVGYAAVLLLVGTLREILGKGSIADCQFWHGRTLSGLLLPFGGFLMIGFAGAVLRTLISRFHPKYLDKKQPKPHAEKAYVSTQPEVTAVPDFAPEETDFNVDELEFDDAPAQQDEQHEQTVTVEAEVDSNTVEQTATQEEPQAEQTIQAVEPENSEVQTEPPVETEPVQTSADEDETESTTDSNEAVSDTEEPEKKEVRTETQQEETVDDAELEKLMNRSMDEIFGAKKEDKK